MPTSKQPHKRIVIQASPSEYQAILAISQSNNVSIANMVRKLFGLPLKAQGQRNDLAQKKVENKSSKGIDTQAQ